MKPRWEAVRVAELRSGARLEIPAGAYRWERQARAEAERVKRAEPGVRVDVRRAAA